jgi:hypothetical protein
MWWIHVPAQVTTNDEKLSACLIMGQQIWTGFFPHSFVIVNFLLIWLKWHKTLWATPIIVHYETS